MSKIKKKGFKLQYFLDTIFKRPCFKRAICWVHPPISGSREALESEGDPNPGPLGYPAALKNPQPGVGTGIPIPWDPSPNPNLVEFLGLGLGLGFIFSKPWIGIGIGIHFFWTWDWDWDSFADPCPQLSGPKLYYVTR